MAIATTIRMVAVANAAGLLRGGLDWAIAFLSGSVMRAGSPSPPRTGPRRANECAMTFFTMVHPRGLSGNRAFLACYGPRAWMKPAGETAAWADAGRRGG